MSTRRALPNWTVVSIALLMSIPVIQGCAGGGNGPQKSAADYTADGWDDYAAGDYSAANSDFQKAIDKDPDYAPAYLGGGWAVLNLKDADSAVALLEVGHALTSDSAESVDFHALLALAQFENEEYAACIESVDSVLSHANGYVFAHDTGIDHTDLLVAKANSYFQLGGDANLANSAEIVHEIDATIDLDPTEPTSWVVTGTTYASFSEALLRALEHVAAMAA